MSEVLDVKTEAPVRCFKPYHACKDSGVKWLGQIPKHWDIQKLKHISSAHFSTVDKHSIEDEVSVHLCNYVDVYYNDHITSDVDFMNATAVQSEIARFTLKKGDVLITKDSESWDDIAVAAYVSEDLPGVLCGYHLALVRPAPEMIDGQYLFRSFGARGINDQFRVAATGITRYGLGKYWLDSSLFPVPPVEEQRTIAAFIDRETEKIDALIAKKERLIELLYEKRTALISHAVTKSLDANAPMKDSGVEWLGKIPTHWEIKRLKFLVVEQLQYGANESAELIDSDLPRYIRITDIKEDGTLSDETFRSLPEEIAKPYLLQVGDMLFARSGATVGKSFMYRESWGRACYAGYLIRARLDKSQVLPEFLSYFAISQNYWDWLSSTFIQATIQNVSGEKYSNLIVPVPPLDEQHSIIQYIAQKTARIDGLIAKVKEGIERLKEYRIALISAAVTGKIDVREEVA